jgi:HAD superfamily hydrolase (TIGR01490 family)
MIAAFFDIDGTIYRNSLLTEHFKKLIKYDLLDFSEYDRRVKEAYKLWDERVGNYDNYLEDLTGTYVDAIKGLPIKYNDFVADKVVELKGNRVYAYTREMIKWHKKQGHLVIFISGSPDFLVSRMAKKWDADDFCGSTYHTGPDGTLTGEISPMWDSPNKLKSIHKFVEKYGINLSKSYAYGDTHGDITMLELVGNPRAVNPSLELLTTIKNNPELCKKTEVIVERTDVIYSLSPDVKIIAPHF